MNNSLKTIINHQGHRLSLEVWAAGLDERDGLNKQYKFGMQIYQIPMSGMLRFNTQFIHDNFGDSPDLQEVLASVSVVIEKHIEQFIEGRVSAEKCEEWLLDEVIRKAEK